LLGCGDQQASEQGDPSEPTASLRSALNPTLSQNCINAPATASGRDFYTYFSPAFYTQTNCFKAVVVDYETDVTYGGFGGAPPNSAVIGWADEVPTNQNACEAAWVGGLHFADDGNGNRVFVDGGDAYGVWQPWGRCETPRVFFTGVAPNAHIAASARTLLSLSMPTRPLSIIFTPPRP